LCSAVGTRKAVSPRPPAPRNPMATVGKVRAAANRTAAPTPPKRRRSSGPRGR
jgi:hypothetical protein